MSEPDVKMRLQGGPFDGDRLAADWDGGAEGELPERWWVSRCPHGGKPHWSAKRTPKGELYELDCEDENGWTVYVFTDERLGGQLKEQHRELEMAGTTAGGERPA